MHNKLEWMMLLAQFNPEMFQLKNFMCPVGILLEILCPFLTNHVPKYYCFQISILYSVKKCLLSMNKTWNWYKILGSKFGLEYIIREQNNFKYIIREQNNCKYKDCSSLIHAFSINSHQFHPFLCAKSLLIVGVY